VPEVSIEREISISVNKLVASAQTFNKGFWGLNHQGRKIQATLGIKHLNVCFEWCIGQRVGGDHFKARKSLDVLPGGLIDDAINDDAGVEFGAHGQGIG